MNCLPPSGIERLAHALTVGARMELYFTPKPGLVDRDDNGSHPDLSVPIMERSLDIVADYLRGIVVSLYAGEAFASQKQLAVDAERRLLGELGTNTHKGYLFLSGMLVIARHRAGTDAQSHVRRALAALCADFFAHREEHGTHGERVRRRYDAGGIVQEGVEGFPALFDEALPAFRKHSCAELGAFAMLARLMQCVEDTTALHRLGPTGLERIREDGRCLERLIEARKDPLPYLRTCNRRYRLDGLTMGGVADMLGLALGYLVDTGELALPEGDAAYWAAGNNFLHIPAC